MLFKALTSTVFFCDHYLIIDVAYIMDNFIIYEILANISYKGLPLIMPNQKLAFEVDLIYSFLFLLCPSSHSFRGARLQTIADLYILFVLKKSEFS